MFQTKAVDKIKTYILTFSSENRAAYEIWKNIIKPVKPYRQFGACVLHARHL